MRYILILLIPLLPLSQNTIAQHLSGVVKDSNGPIPGATIQISESLGRVTDLNGWFSFQNLAPGKYILSIRSMGYTAIKKEVEISENEPQEITIILTENSLGLQEVVVTGTMAPVQIKDSPVKIEVIRSEHINTFLPSASTGLIESIGLINGVQEVVSCGVCFTNSISINGLPGPYTAVLLDGTPMYGNLASVYGLNGIPSSMIDRMEVMKGPNSTLYGSEAVAGVINIITKDPEDQPLISADVMGTSHGEVFSNLSFTTRIGKSHGQTGINHAYVNLFEDNNEDGFSDIINLDRFSVFTKWNLARPSEKRWTIAAKYYYEDRRNGVEEYLINRNYQDIRGDDRIYGESIYTNRAEVFGTYEFSMIDALKVDYSFSSHLQDSYYGSDQYLANQHIAFTNLTWSPVIGQHQIVSGLTLRFQQYNDNTIATPHADNQFIPGIFIQDEWKINSNISLLGGTRLDHYSEHGLIFSPRMNVKVSPSNNTTIRGNFGTGFRLVNLFTEDHAFVTGQRQVVITEELKPERSINGSLNLNHLFTLGESQGSLDFDIFYTYFTNKILPDYSDPQVILYENSDGHAVTQGLAATWSHDLHAPLSFSIGLSLLHASETTEDESGRSYTRKIEFAPELTGTLTLNYQWKKARLSFAYSSQITGSMKLPEVYDLDENGLPLSEPRPLDSPPFSIHSLQITRAFKHGLGLYAGIQNIFNYTQEFSPLTGVNDPNTTPGFSNHFDTAYSFAPIHGREAYLGLTWNLKK
jgi:outer membrane receptor for ferrienterochelin and colicins